MRIRGKIFILIIVIAGLVVAFWVINTQLNITTSAINQGVAANLNQEVSVSILQGAPVPVKGMEISVVGAAPVEPMNKIVDKNKQKVVYQSTSSVSGSANQAVSASSAPGGINVIKEPSVEKKKEMVSKGTIIF